MVDNDSLFTASQKPEDTAKLSEVLKTSINELQKIFPKQKIAPLNWNEHYIAIPLDLEVDLPTRGPIGEVDIRKQEPIFLLLNRETYPYKAPSVYSNRRDFPIERLPHLNPTRPGWPPNFCLHRGSLDNWYAEHTIGDLIKRVEGWLRDAAADRLIRREDGFEETRIPEVSGYAIYELSDLRDYVNAQWQQNNGAAGFSFLWYQMLTNSVNEPLVGIDAYAIRLLAKYGSDGVEEPLELSNKINFYYYEFSPNKAKLERMLFGLLVWPAYEKICQDYFGYLPDKLQGFEDWAKSLGIPLSDSLKTYLSKNLKIFAGVPVTLVVPRPQYMIRSESNLEILNFILAAGQEHAPKEGNWSNDTPVYSLGHRAPLTLRRAKEISSHPVDSDQGPLLFVGCGAVGSKMILHLARGGQGKMTLIEHSELSPHHLVRHGLHHQSLGLNKADGIKNTIEGMYYADKESLQIEVIKESAENVFLNKKEILQEHNWLIDATASPMIQIMINEITLPATLSCCRCEIADSGKLGFLSIEGSNRNPRFDDLQVTMFDLAIENQPLSQWLRSNQKQREELIGSVLEEIHIGLSCSSETMRLSDEMVSLHAATFANGFRRFSQQKKSAKQGLVQIGIHNAEDDLTFTTRTLKVRPTTILKARNNPGWEVRLKHGLENEMKRYLRQAAPNETGGLLIGLVNIKRQIIYVTRILPAPPDSKGSPYAFIRGTQDVPERILEIQDNTGGLLGYVGEWHTHPAGGPRLSLKDREAVNKIKRNLDKIPLPTHIMLVTNTGLYPFVFTTI